MRTLSYLLIWMISLLKTNTLDVLFTQFFTIFVAHTNMFTTLQSAVEKDLLRVIAEFEGWNQMLWPFKIEFCSHQLMSCHVASVGTWLMKNVSNDTVYVYQSFISLVKALLTKWLKTCREGGLKGSSYFTGVHSPHC